MPGLQATETEDKDLALREDIRLLGRILGDTVREQAGEAVFDTIMEQNSLLESNPLLARSIRNRFPYLDPLNHMQIELLRRYRGGDQGEAVVTGIHLTINGIAAGLRNSG